MTKADKTREQQILDALEERARIAEHEASELKAKLAKCEEEKSRAYSDKWRAEAAREDEIKFLRSAVNAALGVKAPVEQG